MITSSIPLGSRPGTRFTASFIADAPRSSGRVFRSVPFGAFPTAVRTADTITASFILFPREMREINENRNSLCSRLFACFAGHLVIAKTCRKLIVHHSRRLHEGVYDRTDE